MLSKDGREFDCVGGGPGFGLWSGMLALETIRGESEMFDTTAEIVQRQRRSVEWDAGR